MALSEFPGTRPKAQHRYLRRPAPLYFPTDELVPETSVHMRVRTALFLVLEHALRGRAFVGSDLFVYWDATDPKACLAPDLLVRMGGPPELLPSFKTWEHGAPHVAVEIVSSSDRRDEPLEKNLERYRRTGIAEVVRFDGESADASNVLRLWDNVDDDLVERDLSDPESLLCDALGAYWTIVPHPEMGRMLRLARNADGTGLLPTPEEAARAESEAALARIAELERELARRS
jgi:Uma2 family endonuclease